MNLYYKPMSTFKPGEGITGKKIWFPKITGTSQRTLRDVAEILEKRSTLTSIDVVAVITGLISLIPEQLSLGYTIKLDGLGTFRLHARVTTSVTSSSESDNEIKRALQKTKIHKMK